MNKSSSVIIEIDGHSNSLSRLILGVMVTLSVLCSGPPGRAATDSVTFGYDASGNLVSVQGPSQITHTVSATASAGGTVAPLSQTVADGAVAKVTLAPTAGYGIASVSGCNGTLSGTTYTTGSITADCTVTATFNPIYTLTVVKSGKGTGTVTGSGIDCGNDCTENLPSGSTLTLTATPASGSLFNSWSGACTGTKSTCSLTMTAAKSVTAAFDQAPSYALKVTLTGSGTVTSNPAGISCGSDCSESYVSGTKVTLTALAASGYTFSGWSGACSGTGDCTLSMTAAKSVKAVFKATPKYTLKVTRKGSGTVTSSPAGINCGSDCSESYVSGTKVTLTALAASGYSFSGWSGACSGTSACVLDMTAARKVTATFKR